MEINGQHIAFNFDLEVLCLLPFARGREGGISLQLLAEDLHVKSNDISQAIHRLAKHGARSGNQNIKCGKRVGFIDKKGMAQARRVGERYLDKVYGVTETEHETILRESQPGAIDETADSIPQWDAVAGVLQLPTDQR